MKFLKEEEIKALKEMVKSFALVFMLVIVVLGWFYIAILLILNALDFELIFSFKFLLGSSMISSVIVALISICEENS